MKQLAAYLLLAVFSGIGTNAQGQTSPAVVAAFTKPPICEVHSTLEYTNAFPLLRKAIAASGADYEPQFYYASIPQWQSSDEDIAQDMQKAVDSARRLQAPLVYLWDAEYWTDSQANTKDWPPLFSWRSRNPTQRGSSLPRAGADKYTPEYMEICNNYFALVLDRIHRVGARELPTGTPIATYLETNALINSIQPAFDRRQAFTEQWCGTKSADGKFPSIMLASDELFVAAHQLNDELVSEASWTHSKVNQIATLRTLGWSKDIVADLETAMRDGRTAGVPRSKALFKRKLNQLKEAGCKKIVLCEFFNPNPNDYVSARFYQKSTKLYPQTYAEVFEAVTQFLREQL